MKWLIFEVPTIHVQLPPGEREAKQVNCKVLQPIKLVMSSVVLDMDLSLDHESERLYAGIAVEFRRTLKRPFPEKSWRVSEGAIQQHDTLGSS